MHQKYIFLHYISGAQLLNPLHFITMILLMSEVILPSFHHLIFLFHYSKAIWVSYVMHQFSLTEIISLSRGDTYMKLWMDQKNTWCWTSNK